MKISSTNIDHALKLPVFSFIQKAADELALDTYVIGGIVRDTFLNRPRGTDIDVVTVGSGIALAKKVAELLPGKNQIQIFKQLKQWQQVRSRWRCRWQQRASRMD